MATAAATVDIIARDKASATFAKVSRSIDGAARSSRSMGDSFETAGKKSEGSAAKFGFLGGVVGGFAVTGLAAVKSWAGGAVDAFAAVEDATGAAQVQFGDAADDVVAFAETAAKNFGLSKRAALDAQNTFGTLGKAAGLQDAKLAFFSRQLTGLAGDLASFKGTSTEQAIDAVGAALRGETEPIRAYGVLLDAAAIKAEAMGMGLLKPTKNLQDIKDAQTKALLAQKAYNTAVAENGKDSDQAQRAGIALSSAQRALDKATRGSVGELTQQQKVLASQSLILKQTKDAQGDYNRTATSTANVQKTVSAETENAQAKLGQKLAPVVTKVRLLWLQTIRTLTGVFGALSSVSSFVQRNATTFKVLAGVVTVLVIPSLVRMVAQMVATGVAAAVQTARMAGYWLAMQIGAFRAAGATALAAARVVAGWVLMGLQSMAQAARMAAAWLIAMGPIALAIAAVVGITVLVVKNWDKIVSATKAAWSWVVDKVKAAVSFMTTLFLNFTGPGLIIKHFDSIVAFVKALPGRIAGAARGMFDGITSAFRGAINFIIRGWNGIEFKIPGFKIGPIGYNGFTLGLPDIPQLATGGVVSRPTLAMIGEAGPEAVVPLSRGGVGTTVNITVNGAVDPVATGRQIVAALTSARRAGVRMDFLTATI